MMLPDGGVMYADQLRTIDGQLAEAKAFLERHPTAAPASIEVAAVTRERDALIEQIEGLPGRLERARSQARRCRVGDVAWRIRLDTVLFLEEEIEAVNSYLGGVEHDPVC